MNYQNIVFSQNQSQKRMGKVLRVMPVQVLKKLLFFALYVLGARLNTIASLVQMPTESGKTTINRVMKDGLPAFHDRRKSVMNYLCLINKVIRHQCQFKKTTVP